MKKSLVLLFFLLVPSAASAEELLPAICQQVINPKPETSVTQILTNHVVEKLKSVPLALALDAKELVDQGADSFAGTIESHKPSTVLGASTVYDPTLWETIYDKLLSALAFVIRHWIWAIGVATVFIIGYSFRP